MRLKVEGNADHMVARLGEIPEKVAENLKTVIGALEEELVGKVRAAAPSRTGALKNSIEGRTIATRTGAIATVGANPTGGSSKGSRRDYYAIFVEFGTQERIQKTTERKVGKVVAEMFIHKPFADMRTKILSEMRRAVDEGMRE